MKMIQPGQRPAPPETWCAQLARVLSQPARGWGGQAQGDRTSRGLAGSMKKSYSLLQAQVGARERFVSLRRTLSALGHQTCFDRSVASSKQNRDEPSCSNARTETRSPSPAHHRFAPPAVAENTGATNRGIDKAASAGNVSPIEKIRSCVFRAPYFTNPSRVGSASHRPRPLATVARHRAERPGPCEITVASSRPAAPRFRISLATRPTLPSAAP